jgi:hypothetical protein
MNSKSSLCRVYMHLVGLHARCSTQPWLWFLNARRTALLHIDKSRDPLREIKRLIPRQSLDYLFTDPEKPTTAQRLKPEG